MQRAVAITIVSLAVWTSVLAQSSELYVITLQNKSTTLNKLITKIEEQTPLFISYNPNHLELDKSLEFSKSELRLETILLELTQQSDLDFEWDESQEKIRIFVPLKTTIYGFVKDSLTRESLQSVAIILGDSSGGAFTNEEGYFYLTLEPNIDSIYFSYIGYNTMAVPIRKDPKQKIDVLLVSDARLKTVIIKSDSVAEINIRHDPEIVDINYNSPVIGINGGVDILNEIKQLPGVSIGSEAQNGFTVRGGSPDQNMVLLDGIPIYATSHLGGLSSVFIQKTIKNVNLYKGSVPARFGGKLSSVLDVRLKDGNRQKTQRAISLNLENINGFIEGPINRNTSIVVNARASIIDFFVNNLIPEDSEFVNSDLKYNDLYAKLSHWFSPSNRLSFSVYRGTDKILIEREEQESSFSFVEHNRIEWDNTMAAGHWNVSLSDKVFFHSKVGVSNFGFRSRTANAANETDPELQIRRRSSLDIRTESAQNDLVATANIDYYVSPSFKLKIGLGNIRHRSRPSILEQQSFLADEDTVPDSLYITDEQYVFVESNWNFASHWTLNTGLRFNNFAGANSNDLILEPRVNLQFSKDKSAINLSYSKMSQFLHLLVNPSSGLPNDLWVPSTSNIAPEISNLFSVSYGYNSKKWDFGISGFYSSYKNLIEYSNPYELIQVIVLDHAPFNWDLETRSWEERVNTGTGRAYGLEFNLSYKRERISAEVAYTLSRSERTFNFGEFSRNEFQTFLHKYDRPHNIASSFQYKLDENNQRFLSVSWVYGTGNLWTLDEFAEPDINGNPIFVARDRNNQRLSAYHRLGISYKKNQNLAVGGRLEYTFGIYNVYNNRNPFYSYLEETSPERAEAFTIKEISLYPVFPQINFSYMW